MLFGDELQSQLNNIKATNKIGHTTTAKPSYRNHSDGWKGKPRFFREEGPVLPATQQQFIQITGNREEIQPVKCTDIPTNKVNMLQYLEHKVYCLKAGGLKQYCNQWQALTSDPEILQTILGQPIEFTGTPYQRVVPREKTVIDLDEQPVIDTEIDKLLAKGFITPSSHEEGEYISPIFTRAKRDGSFWLF